MDNNFKIPKFRNRIRQRLFELDKKQTDMARYCGVSIPMVNHWAKNVNNPNKGDNIRKVCEFLEINPDQLFYLK